MKKFISMAMALVMTLSLCTFVIAPKAEAGFDDTGELAQYSKQAIDVIQAIQVMDGTSEGIFSPAAGLTRQAAAKIICNMILGPATAKALPTNDNPFPDVAAGSTFSGYISYCKQQGIISGYADGTFKGSNPLSGYAYLKMLLGALGYASAEEGFTGSNWKVNVAKLALGKGLNKGIPDEEEGEEGAQLDGQITRESAAIYAFNTLQADMVEYEGKNTLEINGVKVTMGGANAVPQTWNTSSTSANNINDAKSDGNNQRPIVQFAERYFDKLRREPAQWDTYTQGAFGRPSIQWFWKGVEIGTYAEDPTIDPYHGNVAANAIYNDLLMGSADNEAEVFFNGRAAGTVRIAKSNGDDLDTLTAMTKGKIGDGTIVEVYHNDATNHVTICVINVWAGKIVSFKDATSTKRERAVLEVGKYEEGNLAGMPVCAPKGITSDSERREYELKDEEIDLYEEDDIVAYLYDEADNEIKEILYQSALGAVEGALTRRYDGKSMVLEDEPYKYAKGVVFNLPNNRESDLTNKSEYIAYLDEDELVLWVEESEFSVDQYAVVDRIWIENLNASNVIFDQLVNGKRDNANYPQLAGASATAPRVRLIVPTGRTPSYTLNESKAYRNDATDSIAANFRAGEIVRFSSTSDGTYKLQSVKAENKVTYDASIVNRFTSVKYVDANSQEQTVNVKNAVDNNTLYGFRLSDGKTVTADSNTRFVINDNGTYKTYTGVRNAPDIYGLLDTNHNAVDPVGYAYCKGTLAKIVYFTICNLSNTSKDITFLAAPSVSKMVSEDDPIPYYEYNAVVKNNITTIRVAAYANGQSSGAKLTLGNENVTTGSSKKADCILLNTTDYNSDDVLTSGSFTATTVTAHKAQGVKRVSGSIEEIKLYTLDRTEISEVVSENVHVFFSNLDGEIEEWDIDEIRTDGNDYVYYTKENGDITNIFIQQVDDDSDTSSTPTVYRDGDMSADNTGLNWVYHYRDARPNLPAVQARLESILQSSGITPNTTSSVINGNVCTFVISGATYRVTLSADAVASVTVTANTSDYPGATVTFSGNVSALRVSPGDEVKFTITANGSLVTSNVTFSYNYLKNNAQFGETPVTIATAQPTSEGVWSLTIPSDAADGQTITINVK